MPPSAHRERGPGVADGSTRARIVTVHVGLNIRWMIGYSF
jgi:hypothetical protein